MKVEFNQLHTADLIPEAIYLAGKEGNLRDEPLSKLFKVDEKLKSIGNQSGIRKSVIERKGIKKRFAYIVIISTSNIEEWQNHYDSNTGILKYYGDNKEIGKDYKNTKHKGNELFEEVFKAAYGTKEDRLTIPPIFYFEKIPKEKDMKYVGLALPVVKGKSLNEVLKLEKHTNAKGSYQNYKAHFTIVKNENIRREWIKDLKLGRGLTSLFVPEAWIDFIKNGKDVDIPNDENNNEIIKEHSALYLTNQRLTQHKFREKLIEDRGCKCELCDIALPELLIASHILPWVLSDDSEKLDVNNGLLLCANHHKLFDQGLISFNNDGDILISSIVLKSQYVELKIDKSLKITTNDKLSNFLSKHRALHAYAENKR